MGFLDDIINTFIKQQASPKDFSRFFDTGKSQERMRRDQERRKSIEQFVGGATVSGREILTPIARTVSQFGSNILGGALREQRLGREGMREGDVLGEIPPLIGGAIRGVVSGKGLSPETTTGEEFARGFGLKEGGLPALGVALGTEALLPGPGGETKAGKALIQQAKGFKTAREFVKTQTRLFHGSNQPITEFKSASQLRESLGEKFIPSNIGGSSKFTFFTEDPNLAKQFAGARAFNVEGAGGKPVVTEGFVSGKMIDLSKEQFKITSSEAKLFNQLADALEKKSTMFVNPRVGRSSGIGGADGTIIGELRIAARRAGKGADSRRININFNNLDSGQSSFADVLRDFNINGFKFGDRDTIGRFVEAQAILPDAVKTKQQLTNIFNQSKI